ncbi:barstar family protein [Paenibacillus sp. Soil787]|uniref:barstar family protein n=1 Tax=Paenibacillus sp. Soil787 TaxID=1736411 RepID=UPI0007033DA6|nr:barstar family protein [Paenibacillus sp. Soil787]KRF13619.1 barnase inhibitor [Paenibacillus sp. Soil787]
MEDERNELVLIDVSHITTYKELHLLLKKQLQFPDFYGMNWNAFWDGITGLIEMPKSLRFIGWNNLKTNLPDDAQIMQELLDDLNKQYPSWGCNVEYE